MNVVESHRLSVPCVGQSVSCRCKRGICATNCFLEFQEVLRGNEAHNFRSGGVHDQDADTRPWITDTCAASMALKASSCILIKCHLLKLTLLTTWIVADLPRQRNLKKLGIKRSRSPGVNYFPRCKLNILRGKLKLKVVRCNKVRTVVGKTQPHRKEVTGTKHQQLEMVLAGVD